MKETYFLGAHMVEDESAAQETSEITSIILSVLSTHGTDVHDIKMKVASIQGTTHQLAVTWTVEFTSLASHDWASLSAYVASFAFTAAITSAATAVGSAQHANSFFEAASELSVGSIGMGNVPSPPPYR